MSWRRSAEPTGIERAISAFCYASGGIVGIIYIIISRSSYQSDFFRFHFLQSIVLTILIVLLKYAMQFFGILLSPLLPIIAELLTKVMSESAANGAIGGLLMLIEAVLTAISLLCVYGFIWAALGKFAEIPFISNVVRGQMR